MHTWHGIGILVIFATRSRTMAAPEAAGEIAKMERVSDTPRPNTAVETAPKADPTLRYGCT